MVKRARRCPRSRRRRHGCARLPSPSPRTGHAAMMSISRTGESPPHRVPRRRRAALSLPKVTAPCGARRELRAPGQSAAARQNERKRQIAGLAIPDGERPTGRRALPALGSLRRPRRDAQHELGRKRRADATTPSVLQSLISFGVFGALAVFPFCVRSQASRHRGALTPRACCVTHSVPRARPRLAPSWSVAATAPLGHARRARRLRSVRKSRCSVAGASPPVPAHGFEPRFRDSKSLVLPLDDAGPGGGIKVASAAARQERSERTRRSAAPSAWRTQSGMPTPS